MNDYSNLTVDAASYPLQGTATAFQEPPIEEKRQNTVNQWNERFE